MNHLYIIMVGLPSRGKSTLAHRLREGFEAEGIRVALFNNGELRRKLLGPDSSEPAFYHPENAKGKAQRDELALMNARDAKSFLLDGGQVAILDATNARKYRRELLEELLQNAPILYIECVNDDPDLLEACLQCKARLPEFSGLSTQEAVNALKKRIEYYAAIYSPLDGEAHYLRVDTLRQYILCEKDADALPFYIYIRTVIVSDLLHGLYLARHAESAFNLEGRIGGDPSLTTNGRFQAEQLAKYFSDTSFPYVFSSHKRRSVETVAPFLAQHPECIHVPLTELAEIDAGVCEGMRYEDIKQAMPQEYIARGADKYNYIYPEGEGYVSMRERVEHGLRKALFLSGGKKGILIIGHQAVNRTILSLFLFRRNNEVPYIYVPQNQYFYIETTYRRKLIELVRFMDFPKDIL